MADLKGYRDKSLELLNKNNIEIGDLIKIIADLSYTGILMPRYETSQDSHIVLKLKSGYNIGIELEKIEKIEKISSAEKLSLHILTAIQNTFQNKKQTTTG